MATSKITLFLVNLLGGVAVIGSYIVGLSGHPGQGDRLWGGIPQGLRSVYTVSMLLSAIGYLLFFYHIVIRMDPSKARLPWNVPYGSFVVPFLLILIPSALWMSLTFAYLASPSTSLWIAVRFVLGLAALGSLAMLFMLAGLKSLSPDQFWWPSTIGAAIFTFHLLCLDALLWPALFRS